MQNIKICFYVKNRTVFNVSYYKIPGNRNAYFSTSCDRWNKNLTDCDQGGQAQDRLLPEGAARDFWKKWDKHHLQELTDEQLQDLQKDIDELKKMYSWNENPDDTDEIRAFIMENMHMTDKMNHIGATIQPLGGNKYAFNLVNRRTGAEYAGIYHAPRRPQKWEILSSLANDAFAAELSEREFILEFGYNDDPLKGLDIRRECQKSADGLKKLDIDPADVQ